MQQKIQKVIDANPKAIQSVDSGLSYAGGAGLFGFASLADLATVAQQVGMILGCLVIFVKLLHDVIMLRKDFKKEEK